MKLSNTIDLVRSNNGQEGHSNHLWLRFLDDRNSVEQLPFLGEFALNSLEEVQVDLVNDLQVSWKQVLEQWDRPFLKSLW